MPCDSLIYNSISFEAATGHVELLADAMREQGYTVQQNGETLRFNKAGLSGSYSNGKFHTQSPAYGEAVPFNVDAIKQSFGTGVMRKAAKQYGWKVKSIGNNKYEVTKG